MRIGIPAFCAARTTWATLSDPPMLPGLIRTAATPCSIAFNARLALKWMSAITGMGENRTIRPRASASSVFGTATRTISQPAEASAAICAVVASTSCGFVSVTDWTTTGAPPPMFTPPTLIWRSEGIPSPSLAPAEPADVVRKTDEHQHQEECDPDGRDALVDLPADRPTAQTLHDREEDVPAVERQQREQVEDREREADQPEHEQVPGEADRDDALRDVDDPRRPRHLFAARAGDDARQEGDGRPRGAPVVVEAVRERADRPVLGRIPGRLEAEHVPAADLFRVHGTEHLRLLAAQDGEAGRPAVRRPNRSRHRIEVGRLLRVHGDDRVPGAQPHRLGGRALLHMLDGRVQVAGCADHVCDERQREGDEDVGARTGEDDRDSLPGPLPPVGILAEAVTQLVDAAFRRPCGGRRELRLRDLALELRHVLARGREVSGLERPLDARRFGKDARILLQRRAELHVHVRRRRTVHAGDLHVAAERHRADAVLDALAPHLHERGREAEVEAPRAHADRPRDEEVPRLVDEDEDCEAEDRDRDVHATFRAPSASRRASASASMRSSSSRAADVPAPASVSSTTSAIPRNGSLPSRNAATATSFAALNTHGAVPPRSPDLRARPSSGNVSRSGAWNSSVRPGVKSSGETGVVLRWGYVSANEIGTRMSGWPRCASAAPSRKRTSACTIELGCTTTSIRSYGRPKRKCASISSSPLFASVAESTLIFGPMLQVGCASASSGVTSESSSRVRPRNGPPEAVRTSECTCSVSRPSRHWNAAECSLSTGMSLPAPRRCASSASSPAATKLSLFASARSTPCSSAQSVAGRPAKPTTALRTRSGSARSSCCVTSPPTWVSGARPSTSREPEAAAQSSSSGWASMISSAWRPMEPVAPSSAIRFTPEV